MKKKNKWLGRSYMYIVSEHHGVSIRTITNKYGGIEGLTSEFGCINDRYFGQYLPTIKSMVNRGMCKFFD